MAIIKSNLMNLALKQKLINSKMYYTTRDTNNVVSDIENIIEDFDYDSMTHTFLVKFTNGDTVEFSDKIKYEFEVGDNFTDIFQGKKKRGNRRKRFFK